MRTISSVTSAITSQTSDTGLIEVGSAQQGEAPACLLLPPLSLGRVTSGKSAPRGHGPAAAG